LPLELSKRQREVLGLVCQGLQNSEIAVELDISIRTVKWHLQILFERFHVANRTQLAIIGSTHIGAQGNE